MIDWTALRRPGLARKFILLTGAMILATALLLLLFVLAIAREHTYRELLGHGRSVAAIMAQHSEFGIYTEDRSTLDQIVNSLGADPDVAYAAVLNRTGRTLAQISKTPGWTVPPPVLPTDPAGPPSHRDSVCPENGMAYIDLVAAVVPPSVGESDGAGLFDGVRGPEGPIGYVRLVLSQAQLQKTRKAFLAYAVAITGLLILVGIALTVWMTRRIIRPVQTLNRAALALSEGRMDAPIALGSRDEIGELARSFNTMIRRLQESREAVEQRTDELIDANARLQQEVAERARVGESLRQRQEVLQSVYEMGTTLGQSFQSLCEQVAAHLSGFLQIPIVVVQRFEEGQAVIVTAARDGALVDAEEIKTDPVWVRIEQINALCLTQGRFHEIHMDDPQAPGAAFRTLATFPIKNSKRVMVGMIALADRAPRSIEGEDLHLIEIYANHMAYAMEQGDLEVRLQSAQKTQVIAQLASGVAHEVRNPLNALLTLSEALFMDLGKNSEDREFLVQIRVQVDRLSALMQDLLELGKPIKPAQLNPEPLVPLCRQAIQMWKESHGDATPRVQLVQTDERERLSVRADNLRLQQVLINLLDNAAQHSPETSRILMVLDRSTAGFGRIQVIDQGSGIPEEVLPHVFEPFFTTRKKGTGLGMSLVRHIVENHQGNVAIWNNIPGPGCTAEVRIPLAEVPGG